MFNRFNKTDIVEYLEENMVYQTKRQKNAFSTRKERKRDRRRRDVSSV